MNEQPLVYKWNPVLTVELQGWKCRGSSIPNFANSQVPGLQIHLGGSSKNDNESRNTSRFIEHFGLLHEETEFSSLFVKVCEESKVAGFPGVSVSPVLGFQR